MIVPRRCRYRHKLCGIMTGAGVLFALYSIDWLWSLIHITKISPSETMDFHNITIMVANHIAYNDKVLKINIKPEEIKDNSKTDKLNSSKQLHHRGKTKVIFKDKNSKEKHKKQQSVRNQYSNKTIYINMYNPYSLLMPSGNVFEHCDPSYKCLLTNGKDFFKSSTIVMFTGSHIDFDPPTKLPGQTWILYGLEPPVYFRSNLKQWNRLFNWTMTHRRDSDIPYLYGKFRTKNKLKKPSTKTASDMMYSKYYQNKVKTNLSKAAWIVSRCVSFSNRNNYVSSLQKHMDVHIYGECGNMDCPRKPENRCNQILSENYGYYLSLENSFCRDYITEKSFKIFLNNIDVIPIVYGLSKGQYNLFLPPQSFIDTSQFDHVSELANFTFSLSKNLTRYLRYFDWRKYYKPLRNWTSKETGFCELCKRLHDANFHQKYARLYDNIQKWVYGFDENYICAQSKHGNT